MENEAKLQRRLSPINVWALALGCIIGWGAFVMPGNTFLPQAGPLGTVIAMGIAAVILIIVAFNYSYMIRRFPVAGGEFVYSQKAFGNTHGFICSWFLSLSYLAIVPLNATALALIGRNLLGGIFQVGFHYSVAGYDVYLGEIILAVAALIIIGVMSMRNVKSAGTLQTILVFLLVGGVLVVCGAAFFDPNTAVTALEPVFSPDVNPLPGILAIVAVSPWAFVGFDTIPQSAEEFNFSPSKTKLLMIVSIVFGAAVYAGLTMVTALVVPEGYSAWAAYIADAPNQSGLLALPTFHAAYYFLGTPGVALLGVAVSCAILSGIVGFYMATSRLLMSMAREYVLPEWFAKIDPKFGTPRNAILFVLLIALVAPFFGRTALGWIVDMSSIGAAIGYGYTSLAAMKFAMKDKKTSTIITGALGTVFAIIFAVLLLVPLPGFNCSLATEPYICLVIWVILGTVFYAMTAKKRAAMQTAAAQDEAAAE